MASGIYVNGSFQPKDLQSCKFSLLSRLLQLIRVGDGHKNVYGLHAEGLGWGWDGWRVLSHKMDRPKSFVCHTCTQTYVYGCWTQYLKNSWKSPVSGEACWKRKTRICSVPKDQILFPVCFHSPADHMLQVNLFLCMWVFVLFFQIKLILPKPPGPAVLLFFIIYPFSSTCVLLFCI